MTALFRRLRQQSKPAKEPRVLPCSWCEREREDVGYVGRGWGGRGINEVAWLCSDCNYWFILGAECDKREVARVRGEEAERQRWREREARRWQ